MRPLAQPPVAPKTRATLSVIEAARHHDLRILSHCKLMPGACKSILTAELPAGTRASLRADSDT